MLHEQPGREPTREDEQASLNQETEITARGNWIAFGSGLLLSFLTANSVLSNLGHTPSFYAPPYHDISFPPWTAWLPFQMLAPSFLLLPLALGVILPFTGGVLRKNLVSFAFVRGSLVWAGVCIYWFPLAVYEDGTWDQGARIACQQVHDHGFCGLHLGATGFFYYLFFSGLLLLLFALITTLMIKFSRSTNWQRFLSRLSLH